MAEIRDGQVKCGICGQMFPLVVDGHYISRDDGKVGVVAMFQSHPEDQLYDTFDCPHCGCQNVVQKRKRRVTDVLIGEEVEGAEQIEGQLEIEAEEEQDA